jgi:hypothetical protein
MRSASARGTARGGGCGLASARGGSSAVRGGCEPGRAVPAAWPVSVRRRRAGRSPWAGSGCADPLAPGATVPAGAVVATGKPAEWAGVLLMLVTSWSSSAFQRQSVAPSKRCQCAARSRGRRSEPSQRRPRRASQARPSPSRPSLREPGRSGPADRASCQLTCLLDIPKAIALQPCL